MAHILIAPDSYKGCLSASDVAKTIAEQWQQVRPNDTLCLHPMADGGEGTMEVILMVLRGQKCEAKVSDPLGRPMSAQWGWLAESRTAIIEMAQASGLHCVDKHERDVLKACTYGTGELIKEALNAGAKNIYLTLGGSATNDCGVGMLRALGAQFKDADGNLLPPGGAALANLALIDLSNFDARIKDTAFIAACDVDNPLCGERGASAIFGPQKGATPENVKTLDAALAHCARICAKTLNIDLQ
ncbi:MAG: glycerate kinase, partial [Saezia sp.]